MDADDLRLAGGGMDFAVVIEVLTRIGAVVLLVAIVGLALRARRRSPGDIWLVLVFLSWLIAIVFSAVRWLIGLPPTTLPPLFYAVVFVLEVVATPVMIRESNRVRAARRERDARRDTARDLERDPQRDMERDLGRDVPRDAGRDALRDEMTREASGEGP